MPFSKTVLITGARAPVCLDLMRRFARSGFSAEVGDCMGPALARFSRLSSGFQRLASPRFEYPAFRAQLEALPAYRAIIPTCEETFYCARAREELGRSEIFCDRLEKLDRLHNKLRFALDSAEWPIQAPKSHLLTDVAGLAQLPKPFAEYVFKPVYSRFASRTLVAPRGDLAARLDFRDGPWLAQERVFGEEICLYAVAYEGRLNAVAAYRPVYRVGLGAGIYLEPEADPRLSAFVGELVERLGFHGQLAFDLIREPNGKLWLLECNPRATSGLHFFEDDAALVDCFLGKRSTLLIGDLRRPRMVASAVLAYGLLGETLRGNFGRLWRRFSAGRDVIWDSRDPAPALGQYITFLAFLFQALAQGKSAHQVSSEDFEFNGASGPGAC